MTQVTASTTRKPKRRAPRRSFGRIRQLPSERWQASYLGPDLHTHKAPDTFDTKGRAEGWIAEERKLIDLEIWTSPAARAAALAAEQQTDVLFRHYAEKVSVHHEPTRAANPTVNPRRFPRR